MEPFFILWPYIKKFVVGSSIPQRASINGIPFEAHRIADLIASGMYTEEEAINIARKEQEQKQGESVTEDGILYRYSVLYGRNDEMAGWIQLEGTVINYPVMLTPDDEEYSSILRSLI